MYIFIEREISICTHTHTLVPSIGSQCSVVLCCVVSCCAVSCCVVVYSAGCDCMTVSVSVWHCATGSAVATFQASCFTFRPAGLLVLPPTPTPTPHHHLWLHSALSRSPRGRRRSGTSKAASLYWHKVPLECRSSESVCDRGSVLHCEREQTLPCSGHCCTESCSAEEKIGELDWFSTAIPASCDLSTMSIIFPRQLFTTWQLCPGVLILSALVPLLDCGWCLQTANDSWVHGSCFNTCTHYTMS